MKNERILKNFFMQIREIMDYYVDIKIDDIEKRRTQLGLSRTELQALNELLAKETGRQALSKVLVDYGRSNMFSTLAYIDGCTGTRPIELVNDKTGESLGYGALHEMYASFMLKQNRDLIPTNERF